MKKVLKILGKSLIGVPVAIFLYELLNLAISINLGEYVRIDESILQNVINEYLFCAILGYGLSAICFYTNSLKKGQDTIKSTRKVVEMYGITFIIMIALISLLDHDIVMGLVLIAAISLMVCVCLFIIFLFDKKDVNNINKKIKENKDN